MSKLFEHEKWRRGFIRQTSMTGTTKITTEFVHTRYDEDMDDLPEELIQQELAYKIGKECIEQDLCNYYRNFDQETFEETIFAEINVCKPTERYLNLEGDVFIVNKERFTNEELVKAVLAQYPERFI